jgi:hypothetical protein
MSIFDGEFPSLEPIDPRPRSFVGWPDLPLEGAGSDVVLHLQDLRRLDLKPGETLLVQLKDPDASAEHARDLQEDFQLCLNVWHPGTHVLVLALDMEMTVLSGRWWRRRRRTYAQIEADRHMKHWAAKEATGA